MLFHIYYRLQAISGISNMKFDRNVYYAKFRYILPDLRFVHISYRFQAISGISNMKFDRNVFHAKFRYILPVSRFVHISYRSQAISGISNIWNSLETCFMRNSGVFCLILALFIFSIDSKPYLGYLIWNSGILSLVLAFFTFT